MGVPAFFRWLNLRYPKITQDCVEEVVIDANTGSELPIDTENPNPNNIEFDCLYLDMNGIIHPCTHPEDRPAPKTELEMFREIERYVDRIVSIVRPRKLIYMAIDGVAPRAKINQQRSRRFRAAKEAKLKENLEFQLIQEYKTQGVFIEKSLDMNEEDEEFDDDTDESLSMNGFDSNVITPGTPFMERLADALRKYIAKRVEGDVGWRNVRVVFSDASVAGEGEHKIADFIRQERRNAQYNPNLHHVLYGLDADLIMLGLAVHEARFTILREEVLDNRGGGGRGLKSDVDGKDGGREKKRMKLLEDAVGQVASGAMKGTRKEFGGKKPFVFVHLNVLREYLEYEFADSFDNTAVEFDMERVVDDFVFLCFFVGNDFLPHLPSLEIREGGIDYLIELYKKLVPKLDYVTDGHGEVDFNKARLFLKEIAEKEDEVFRARMIIEQRNAARNTQNSSASHATEKKAGAIKDSIEALKVMPNEDETELVALGRKNDPLKKTKVVKLANVVEKDQKSGEEDQGVSKMAVSSEEFDEEVKKRIRSDGEILNVMDNIRLGESGWKDRYYKKKLGWSVAEDAESRSKLDEFCRNYFEGLLWVMRYYYQGCVSWTWYYPYHYAPFASDLAQCCVVSSDIVFDSHGDKFQPLEQLMSVLPSSSAKGVIPDCFYHLMVDSQSPIYEFYPKEFEIDLNGKRFAWQGIALLPFVDECRLRDALNPLYQYLTDEERIRNASGCDFVMVNQYSALGKVLKKLEDSEDEDAEVELDGNDVEVCGGILFGKVKKYVKKEKDCVGCLAMRCVAIGEYELGERASHLCRLLDGVELPMKVLEISDKYEVQSGTLGWKTAKFGPLGIAAKKLMQMRNTASNPSGVFYGKTRSFNSTANHGIRTGQQQHNQYQRAPGLAMPPHLQQQPAVQLSPYYQIASSLPGGLIPVNQNSTGGKNSGLTGVWAESMRAMIKQQNNGVQKGAPFGQNASILFRNQHSR